MQQLKSVGLLFIGVLLMGQVWAGDGVASHPMDGEAMPPRHEAGHHQPPPEAFAACQGKSKGAVCDVETPNGNLKGTCGAPESKPLACMPNHPPRGSQAERPPVPPMN